MPRMTLRLQQQAFSHSWVSFQIQGYDFLLEVSVGIGDLLLTSCSRCLSFGNAIAFLLNKCWAVSYSVTFLDWAIAVAPVIVQHCLRT